MSASQDTRPAGLDRAGAILLAVAFVVLFGFTRAVTTHYRAHEAQLASSFRQAGAAALAQGRPGDAVAAFRDALFYGKDDRDSQFQLAQALLLAGQPHEARPYLVALWRQDPTLGLVNLELARMEAARGHPEDAVRHYQGAVHGQWDRGADTLRATAHRELISYLKAGGDRRRALAELVAYASTLREDDRAGQVAAGATFLELGEARLALASYRQALASDGDDEQALIGAATAAERAGEWRLVREFLRRLPLSRRDADVARRLEMAEAVLGLDPWAPRISLSERGRRARAAVGAVRSRLAECVRRDPSAQAALEEVSRTLASADRALDPRTFRQAPDALDEAFEVAVAAEALADQRCGEPGPVDEALRWLGRLPRAAEGGDAQRN